MGDPIYSTSDSPMLLRRIAMTSQGNEELGPVAPGVSVLQITGVAVVVVVVVVVVGGGGGGGSCCCSSSCSLAVVVVVFRLSESKQDPR